MAKTTDASTIVVVDDELHNMQWMFDYIESKGLKVVTASTVNAAQEAIDKEIYRAAIVDLNIPVEPRIDASVRSLGETYARFPGLYLARHARNRGYRDRQIIVYSVHKDPAVAEEVRRLGCTYILKGRPRDVRDELDSVVSFDPTTL